MLFSKQSSGIQNSKYSMDCKHFINERKNSTDIVDWLHSYVIFATHWHYIYIPNPEEGENLTTNEDVS